MSLSTLELLAWEWLPYSSLDHTMRTWNFPASGSRFFLLLKGPPTRTNVITTASTTEKLDWLRSFPNGATHAVNYKTQNFADEVKAITDGKGVDVIIDVVGKTHWHKNIESLAFDGRMTLLAFLSGEFLSYGWFR